MRNESVHPNGASFFGFEDEDTYHPDIQLFASTRKPKKKRARSAHDAGWGKIGSERTRFSGLLRAWNLDGLFGVVDVLWPIVIERFELHGWRDGV
jgi:hypothetical protein